MTNKSLFYRMFDMVWKSEKLKEFDSVHIYSSHENRLSRRKIFLTKGDKEYLLTFEFEQVERKQIE